MIPDNLKLSKERVEHNVHEYFDMQNLNAE